MSLEQAAILARSHGLLPKCIMQATDIMRKQVSCRGTRTPVPAQPLCILTCPARPWADGSLLPGPQGGDPSQKPPRPGPDAAGCATPLPPLPAARGRRPLTADAPGPSCVPRSWAWQGCHGACQLLGAVLRLLLPPLRRALPGSLPCLPRGPAWASAASVLCQKPEKCRRCS